MSLEYVVGFDNLSLTNDADQDIMEAVNGAACSAELLEFQLSAALTTDERLRLRWVRRSTTGSGGSAMTENPLNPLNTVTANLAVSTLVTTPGTVGAVLPAFYWSLLTPLYDLPIPEGRIWIPPSTRLCLHLQTPVGSTRSISGFMKWREG